MACSFVLALAPLAFWFLSRHADLDWSSIMDVRERSSIDKERDALIEAERKRALMDVARKTTDRACVHMYKDLGSDLGRAGFKGGTLSKHIMKSRLVEWRGDVRQGREERTRKGGTEDVGYRGYCEN